VDSGISYGGDFTHLINTLDCKDDSAAVDLALFLDDNGSYKSDLTILSSVANMAPMAKFREV